MIKRIKYILLILATFSGQYLFAQLQLGARVGLNYSDLQITEFENPIIENITTTSDFGYEFGFYAKANIMRFYIQPEIIFNHIYGGINVSSVVGNAQEYDFHLVRLDAPFPIGFNLGSFTVFAGPIASFNLNSGASIFDNTYNYGTWSLLAGGGVNIGHLNIGLRYQRALTKHANEAEIIIGEDLYRPEMEMRTSYLSLTIGYTFQSSEK